jgi:hypothetical protein
MEEAAIGNAVCEAKCNQHTAERNALIRIWNQKNEGALPQLPGLASLAGSRPHHEGNTLKTTRT